MTDAKRPLKVFLCHASADKPKVRELYRTLRRRGMQPWLDTEDLIPGQTWEVEIPKALFSSDAIIICLSPNSVDKEGYVQKEIKFALDKALEMPEGRIFLIPARLEECDLPYSLSKYQAVNLFEKNGYTKLMKALKLRASQLHLAVVDLPKAGEITGEIEKIVEEKKSPEPKEEKPETKTTELSESSEDGKTDVSGSLIIAENGDVINTGNWKEYIVEKPAPDKLELEKPHPKKTKPPRKPNTAIIVALIGLAGTIVAALLSSPVIETWFSPAPIDTESVSATTVSTLPSQQVELSKTIEPSQTPTILNLTSTPKRTFTPAPTLGIGSESTSEKDNMVMIYIPGGDFEMGYSSQAAYSLCTAVYNYCPKSSFADIEPQKTVYLDSFWIGKTEVTNEMYKKCVDAGVCQVPPTGDNDEYYGNDHFAGRTSYDSLEYANYPVVRVSWEEANRYCSWAGGRLPTEAEWEKTTRGPNGNIYPWGNTLSGSDLYFEKQLGTLSPVGQFPNGASFYGVLDLAGNVWEWVSDWYDISYYAQSPAENPEGPTSGQEKTIRGGYHDLFATIAPSMIRTPADPDLISNHVGFRCAMDANP